MKREAKGSLVKVVFDVRPYYYSEGTLEYGLNRALGNGEIIEWGYMAPNGEIGDATSYANSYVNYVKGSEHRLYFKMMTASEIHTFIMADQKARFITQKRTSDKNLEKMLDNCQYISLYIMGGDTSESTAKKIWNGKYGTTPRVEKGKKDYIVNVQCNW